MINLMSDYLLLILTVRNRAVLEKIESVNFSMYFLAFMNPKVQYGTNLVFPKWYKFEFGLCTSRIEAAGTSETVVIWLVYLEDRGSRYI